MNKQELADFLSKQGYEYCVICQGYMPADRLPEGDICNRHLEAEQDRYWFEVEHQLNQERGK